MINALNSFKRPWTLLAAATLGLCLVTATATAQTQDDGTVQTEDLAPVEKH